MLSCPSAFITPSSITMGVLPSQMIPPQMCTFTGCLALEMNKWEVKHAKYNVYMQCTCTCTYIHVCMYMYTYIHTHLHIYVHAQLTSFESLTSVWVLVVLPFFSNYGACGFPVVRSIRLSTPHHETHNSAKPEGTPWPTPVSLSYLLLILAGNMHSL